MPRPVPHKKHTNLTLKVGEEYATDAYGNKICDTSDDCGKKNIRYSHLPNEITGSYHNDKEASWLRFAVTTIIVVSLFAALLILGEFTGLTSKLFGTV